MRKIYIWYFAKPETPDEAENPPGVYECNNLDDLQTLIDLWMEDHEHDIYVSGYKKGKYTIITHETEYVQSWQIDYEEDEE